MYDEAVANELPETTSTDDYEPVATDGDNPDNSDGEENSANTDDNDNRANTDDGHCAIGIDQLLPIFCLKSKTDDVRTACSCKSSPVLK